MEKASIDNNEIEIELRAFFDVVQSEMVRLTYRWCRPGGDAA
jgi:hypothetical protein